MGDWRRVRVVGTCESEPERRKLRELLAVGFADERWDCLCSGGVCGLPNFGGSSEFDVVGNLGERGYDEESVAGHLRVIAEACPSLALRVHVGDHYEEKGCVATVVLEAGEVRIEKPEVEEIPEFSSAQIRDGLMSQLFGGGVR
jgi:hypothetical protein